MTNQKQSKSKAPIMSEDDERFMAWSGLIQWAEGVIAQCQRVKEAADNLNQAFTTGNHVSAMHRLHCEAHYYAIAANKVLEYRTWAHQHGLFKKVDFTELNKINAQTIKDLRNMREHVVEYFQGEGRSKDRWIAEMQGIAADASSMVGSLIGGRLDYIQFTEIIKIILPMLLEEPIPFPRNPEEVIA